MRKRGASRSGGLRWLLLLAAVATTGFAHARMDTSARPAGAALRIPEPEPARWLSLGFAPVLADYYWVQGLYLVGGSGGSLSVAHGDEIASVVDLVTHLDPWVDHPYRFGAIWGTRDVETVRRANRLLRQSLSYHPDDWRNRFYLGYNLFFYLQDNQAAADVLAPAVTMEGAPQYLGAFVARLRADGGDLDTAALFLDALIRETPDEYARAEYLKARDEIETERRARFLDEARARFVARRGRDIRSPEELWSGPQRVLRQAPPPHPHFPGFAWVLDENGQIVSSFYGTRYRIHIHRTDRELRARWREQLEAEERRADADPGGPPLRSPEAQGGEGAQG